MKKVCIITLLLVGVITFSSAGSDFRNVDWGMTVDEVKGTESLELQNEENYGHGFLLMYEDTFGGLSCKINYNFVQINSDSTFILARAGYYFSDPVWENDQFFYDFTNIRDIITKQYGEPSKYREGWTPSAATEPAAKSLDVSYSAQWQTPTTQIDLGLEGYKDMWGFLLEYNSREQKKAETRAEANSQVNVQGEIVFSGVPEITITETGITRSNKNISKEKAIEYKCTITIIDSSYYWTSRGDVVLVPIVNGAFTTFIAVNGAGYVKIVNPEYRKAASIVGGTEAKFVYVEHLIDGLKTFTYYGNSE